MFAKIFCQIFDSSLAEKPDVRFTFMDMLILADADGVVNMTPESISRRTNRPLGLILETIKELEAPDPRSQSSTAEGRRIERLSGERDWGWIIINFQKYRDFANDCQRREDSRERVRKFRKTHGINGHQAIKNSGETLGKRGDTQKLEAEAEAEAEGEGERERSSLSFSEIPSWNEFWQYCLSPACGLGAEWYAKDKWEAATASNWKGKENWKAHARRCRTWWEQDGRPMQPPRTKTADNSCL